MVIPTWLERKSYRVLTGGCISLCLALLCSSVSAPGAAGCTTHECDGQFECVYPPDTVAPQCAGVPVVPLPTAEPVFRDGDEYVWYSSAIQGPWFEFHPNNTLAVYLPTEIVGLTLNSVHAWVSSDDANQVGAVRKSTDAAGQLVEYTYTGNNAVNVFNGTCASYALRLEIRMAAPAASLGADASAHSDASLAADGSAVTLEAGANSAVATDAAPVVDAAPSLDASTAAGE